MATSAQLRAELSFRIRMGAPRDWGKFSELWMAFNAMYGGEADARERSRVMSCVRRNMSERAAVRVLRRSTKAGTATPVVKLAFEFIVLTGARSGEARGARWSEFDVNLSTWIVPGERMKAGREHRVPLSTRAREVLLETRKLQGIEDHQASNGLVFLNPKSKPYSDMVFTQLMRRMGLEYTMHGFRATFRTWGMEATQYPDEMLEFALAHVIGDQTVRAYARSDMVEKRKQLMEDWAIYALG